MVENSLNTFQYWAPRQRSWGVKYSVSAAIKNIYLFSPFIKLLTIFDILEALMNKEKH